MTAVFQRIRIPRDRRFSPAGGARFTDLGVFYLNGGPLHPVPFEPLRGQYAVSETEYQFSESEDRRRLLLVHYAIRG